MKYRMVYFLFLLAVIAITGCTKQPDVKDDKATAFTEMVDLDAAMASGDLQTDSPQNYELTATINLSKEADADRIVYEYFIKKFKEPMKDVVMSFSLDKGMKYHLLTSDVFTTNAINEAPVNLIPNQEPFGLSLARAFVLDKQKINAGMKQIYKTMNVKITYTDNDSRKTEYYTIQAVPSKELEDYISLSQQ